MAEGRTAWTDSKPLPWPEEVARFHAGLAKLDAHLASGAPVAVPLEKLFQGPIADAFTHVGQIALLRRLGGGPVRGENYYRADIEAGAASDPDNPPLTPARQAQLRPVPRVKTLRRALGLRVEVELTKGSSQSL